MITRTSEPPRLRVLARLRELYSYREILKNLVRKELKVKYTSSVLGAIWSLLNPIVFLGVFYFVFTQVLRNDVPDFAVYLLSGLLAWNLFSASLLQGARSVIDNANLVKKVYFPREILPLSSVGVGLVDFLLQGLVLLLFMAAIRYEFHAANLALLPLAMLTLLVFTVAVSFWVAALNVRFRDIQHLLNLALLMWFWLTPIVYPSALIQQHDLFGISLFRIYVMNPVAVAIFGFQRALYGIVYPSGGGSQVLVDVRLGWLATALAAVLAASTVLLWLTWRLFFRRSGDFAEEL